jgi:hypothetical protein
MPALFPSMVAPESFRIGDCVRKFITDWNVTPYIGTVTHILPKTYKVSVQWPLGNTQEDPETLVKVNPAVMGMPSAMVDYGYDSYEKSHSEQDRGQVLPKRPDVHKPVPMPMQITARDKMGIRIAHTFASDVVGKLVEDICGYQKKGCSDVQTYNRIFSKYGNICSDYIIRSSIEKVFKVSKE